MDLFESGFYGKGILSRSKPNWKARATGEEKRNEAISPVNKRKDGFHRKSKRLKVDGSEEQKLLNCDEHLQLCLEEAFFLVFTFGSLRILDETSRNLSVSDCWRLFSESQPNFPVSYACYHHYRSNSWTPRGGSKFGADWVLYHKGPSHYHAERAVVVVDSPQTTDGPAQPALSWTKLIGLNRVAEQVKKGLVFCVVHHPPGPATDVNWLQTLSIQEVSVKRWTPQRTREGE